MAGFFRYTALGGVFLTLCVATALHPQILQGDAQWVESEVPDSPAFDVGKLVTSVDIVVSRLKKPNYLSSN